MITIQSPTQRPHIAAFQSLSGRLAGEGILAPTTADIVSAAGTPQIAALVGVMRGPATARVVSGMGGAATGALVKSMGGETTGRLVRDMGPKLSAEVRLRVGTVGTRRALTGKCTDEG